MLGLTGALLERRPLPHLRWRWRANGEAWVGTLAGGSGSVGSLHQAAESARLSAIAVGKYTTLGRGELVSPDVADTWMAREQA